MGRTTAHWPRRRIFCTLALFAIFGVSLLIRLPVLNKPLSHPREWLTATVLRHLEIWNEEGLAATHFAPITTYPGAANRNINNEASEHKDAVGNYYYTSFPPLAYYVPYFTFKLMHITLGVLPIQIFSLVLHFISGLLVYLSVRLLLNSRESSSVPALIAFAIYVFSPLTLWLQANVYMSDIFAEIIFIAGIYLLLRWAKLGGSGRFALIIGTFTFFFVYSDWLGVLFAASIALYAVIQRTQPSSWSLGIAASLGTAAALALTLWQYSQINGLHSFLFSLTHRFALRSGIGHQLDLNLHIWRLLGWLLILTYYALAHGADILLLILWAALLRKEGAINLPRDIKLPFFFGAVMPVLLHHLILFNYTAAHEFSVLKAAPAIAILAGLLSSKLWQNPFLVRGRSRLVLFTSLALCFAVCVWQYWLLTGPSFPGCKTIGDFIAQNARPDEIVFAEYLLPSTASDRPLPQIVYYAHRNIAVWQDQVHARQLSQENGVPKIVVFTINPAETQVIAMRRMSF